MRTFDKKIKMHTANVLLELRRIKYKLLTEIDWKDDFSDVGKKCINTEALVDYLNRVQANAGKHTTDREKFDKGTPYIHAKSSFFNKDSDIVDLDFFINKITSPPNNIINTNDKILKTGVLHEFVYKTRLPVFRGIAYDIDKEKFYYINTCPGAGECVNICYAMKGNYVRYPVSYDSMTQRLNYLLNYPEKYEERMYMELKAKAKEHHAIEGYKNKVLLRWNDSGDFFTKKYVDIAERVMKRLKSEGYNVDSYLYTKVADVATNSDIGTTSFSSGANKKQSSQIDMKKQKNSMLVPTELFRDLNMEKISDEETLKNRVSKFFGISKNALLTYDELMTTHKSDIARWHVIVTPNDGDDARTRKDVKSTLLIQH